MKQVIIQFWNKINYQTKHKIIKPSESVKKKKLTKV